MEFSNTEFIKRLTEVTNGAQQKEIAEKTGVSTSTVSRWFNENNKKPPSSEHLISIADAYNCNIAYLLCSYPTKEGSNDDGQLYFGKSYPDMIRIFLDLFMCGILKADIKSSPETLQEKVLETSDLTIKMSNEVCAYLLKEVANFYELYQENRITSEDLEAFIKRLCDDFDGLWYYDLPFVKYRNINQFLNKNRIWRNQSEREQFRAYARELHHYWVDDFQ